MREGIEELCDFFYKLEDMKTNYRYSEAPKCKESSADHVFKMAFMSYAIAEHLNLNVNKYHAAKIVLAHDLSDAVIKEIDSIRVWNGEITKEKKQEMEHQAVKELTQKLPEKLGKEMYSLWKEFEEGKTKEAKYAKALDKLECLSHLIKTGFESYDKPEYIPTYADEAISKMPDLIPFLKVIKTRLKQEFEKGNIEWKPEYNKFLTTQATFHNHISKQIK